MNGGKSKDESLPIVSVGSIILTYTNHVTLNTPTLSFRILPYCHSERSEESGNQYDSIFALCSRQILRLRSAPLRMTRGEFSGRVQRGFREGSVRVQRGFREDSESFREGGVVRCVVIDIVLLSSCTLSVTSLLSL